MITGEELNKILSWPLRFDLHTHTNVSDGIYTPEELVSYAAKRKVDVLAITDHDNIGNSFLEDMCCCNQCSFVCCLRQNNGLSVHSCLILDNIDIRHSVFSFRRSCAIHTYIKILTHPCFSHKWKTQKNCAK